MNRASAVLGLKRPPQRPRPLDPLIVALRDRREAAGLRREDLAKRAGVPAASIGNWERGLTTPTLAVFRRLAEALGLTMAVTVPTTTPQSAIAPRTAPLPPPAPNLPAGTVTPAVAPPNPTWPVDWRPIPPLSAPYAEVLRAYDEARRHLKRGRIPAALAAVPTPAPRRRPVPAPATAVPPFRPPVAPFRAPPPSADDAAIATFLATRGATRLPSSREMAAIDPPRPLRWNAKKRKWTRAEVPPGDEGATFGGGSYY